VNEAGGGGGGGPEKKAETKNVIDVETVGEPTDEKKATGVRVKKSGEEHAELSRRKAEFGFESRASDGEIGAVDIVDENGDVQKNYGKEQRPEALRRSF